MACLAASKLLNYYVHVRRSEQEVAQDLRSKCKIKVGGAAQMSSPVRSKMNSTGGGPVASKVADLTTSADELCRKARNEEGPLHKLKLLRLAESRSLRKPIQKQ